MLTPKDNGAPLEDNMTRANTEKYSENANALNTVLKIFTTNEWKNALLNSPLEDLMSYIKTLKIWIDSLHYVWAEVEHYKKIIINIENQITIKLFNKYHDTHELLTANEWDFLATYFLDYGTQYLPSISDKDLKVFFDLEESYYFSNQTLPHELEEILNSKIDRLFEKAGEVVQKFLKLGETSPESIPEQPYNPRKTAGFITLSVDGIMKERRQMGTGDILKDEDEEFWTKGHKYLKFATKKDLFAVLEHKEYSEDTSFKIKGRIEFYYERKKIGFSCSWWSQLQDQAIVILAAHKAGMIFDEELVRKQKTLNNPYLEHAFIEKLNSI